jgi:hypothetical protein
VAELEAPDQMDIVRALETHSLQLMDEYCADHQDDDQIERIGGPEEPLGTEERMIEFQQSVHSIRQLLIKHQL